MRVDTPVAADSVTTVNTTSTAAKVEESIESIGQMIEDLFDSDHAKINAALDALNLNLEEDKKKCYTIQVALGSLSLVLLLKKCLAKAIDESPACDQVADLNDLAELTALHKTLHMMISLAQNLDESKVGMAAAGSVEAVVKAMKTFPKCQALQEFACKLVFNLASCIIGNTRVVEKGGMEVSLAATNNHLRSASVCKYSCIALSKIIEGNKEDTRFLISLGGAATVTKVREEWPDGDIVQAWGSLATLIGTEMCI